MKRLTIFFAIVILPGCPITQDTNTPVDHTVHRESSTGAKYYRYVPEHYDSDRSWPLVITLHGTRPYDTRWAQIREWKMLGEKEGFLVVAPQLGNWSTQGILPKFTNAFLSDLQNDEKIILAVRNEMCRKYNVDRKKILLTGFSSGGYSMYWTGIRNPGKFSGLAARSCNSDNRIFNAMKADEIERKIPTVIIIGKDENYLTEDSWRSFKWMRTHGWSSKNCNKINVRGGHLRRPGLAYKKWLELIQPN